MATNGFVQKYDADYEEMFVPEVRCEALKNLISIKV